jgi:tight adherence protein C
MLPTFFLRLGSFVCLFLSVTVIIAHWGKRKARAMKQFGLRGLRRRQALVSEDLWRIFEPGVRWLATVLSRTLSEETRLKLDAQLTRAGDPLGLEPEEMIVLTLMSGVLGSTVGILYVMFWQGTPAAIGVFGIAAALIPIVRIDALAQERTIRIQRGLPAAVDLMCLGLSAGLDFPAAVRQIVEKTAQKNDALIDELSLVLSELQLGKTRREALEIFAERNPIDAVKEFVGFVVQSEEEGNPLAQILSIQATVARQRRGVRAEEMAGKATLKIIAPIGLVLMSVLILIAAPLIMSLMGSLNGL